MTTITSPIQHTITAASATLPTQDTLLLTDDAFDFEVFFASLEGAGVADDELLNDHEEREIGPYGDPS